MIGGSASYLYSYFKLCYRFDITIRAWQQSQINQKLDFVYNTE